MTQQIANHAGLVHGQPMRIRTYDDGSVTAEVLTGDGRGMGEVILKPEPLLSPANVAAQREVVGL